MTKPQLTVVPPTEPVEDENEKTTEQTSSEITLSKAVESTIVFVHELAKRYSMKQDTVLEILKLQLQLFHMQEEKQMRMNLQQGQAMVDAIAAEQAARREPDEEIG